VGRSESLPREGDCAPIGYMGEKLGDQKNSPSRGFALNKKLNLFARLLLKGGLIFFGVGVLGEVGEVATEFCLRIAVCASTVLIST